jgi:CheY-like chemotaxis protein
LQDNPNAMPVHPTAVTITKPARLPKNPADHHVYGTASTILLVDDDPLKAYVRRAILQRRLSEVERAADASEAFILIEQPRFAVKLGLIIVALHLPGISGPAFVSELTNRLPSVPVLVLGQGGEKASDYSGPHIHFMPRPVSTEEMLTVSRQLLTRGLASVA